MNDNTPNKPQISSAPSLSPTHTNPNTINDITKKDIEDNISDSSSDTGYSSDTESEDDTQMVPESDRKSISISSQATTSKATSAPSPTSSKRKRQASSVKNEAPEKKKKRTNRQDLSIVKSKTSDVLKGKKIAVQGM